MRWPWVVTGYLVSGRLPDRYRPRIETVGRAIANLVILWIIAVVVGKNREPLLALDARLFAALLLLNGLGYTIGYLGGYGVRLPESMRRALTLEVGMQNAGLGATLATELFPDRPEIALPPALYTFGCMLSGTLLARYWARKPLEKTEPNKLSIDE